MRIRNIKNNEERALAARWATEGSSPQAVERAVHFWTEVLPREPGYEPERQRVVEVEGRMVSHLCVVDREMQVGLATLRMGGIGTLITAPEHRGQGYGQALMKDTLAYLTAQGFDLSCLDSTFDFYQRFGYAAVMPRRQVRFEVKETLALDPLLAVRPLSAQEVPVLERLYERCWRGRVGALVRDGATWQWQLRNARDVVVAIDDGNQVRGYAVYGDQADQVWEAGAADTDAVAALLSHLARRAQQAGLDNFYVNLPADFAFVRLARALCSLEILEHVRPSAGWQARLLNVASVFAKLEPEFSVRLARSTQASWRGSLRLESEIGGVTLQVDRTGVRVDNRFQTQVVCYLPQTRLVQLLFGYLTVAEAAAAPGSQVPYKALPILAALFPPVVAYIAGLDWF